MKKLLSLIAASALALGVIGCSGDLHDVAAVDLSGLQVKGSIFTWANDPAYKLTEDTDGSYYYEFIATAASATFALDDTTNNAEWASTYRGTASDELCKDFEKGPATADLYAHNDGDCMPLTLEAGATYRIIAKSGAGFVTCTVKKVKEAIPFKLVTGAGEELDLAAVSGSDFAYKLVKEEAGTIKFYVKASVANYSPATDTALSIGVADEDISGETGAATTYWTFNYEANVPYKLSVSYNSESGDIDVTAGYAFILDDNILSGSQFSDNVLTWNFTSEYAYAEFEFTYSKAKDGWGNPYAFAVHNNGWGHKFCGGAKVKVGDYVELPADGDNAELTDLVDGTEYILTIKTTETKCYAKLAAK